MNKRGIVIGRKMRLLFVQEGCFLFDEEQQQKMDSLESLCSLQAMKIYELAHTMEKIVQKQEDQPATGILSSSLRLCNWSSM